jgi:hypothetical protein
MAVAEAVAAGIKPIREAYEGMSDQEVDLVMSESADRARASADETLEEVRAAVGLS